MNINALLNPDTAGHRLLDAIEQVGEVRSRWQAAVSWYHETHAKGQGTTDHRSESLARLEARSAEYAAARTIFSMAFAKMVRVYEPFEDAPQARPDAVIPSVTDCSP